MRKRSILINTVALVSGVVFLSACVKRPVGTSSSNRAQTGQVSSVLRTNPDGAADRDNTAANNVNANVTNSNDNDNRNVVGAPDASKGYFAYDSSDINSDAEDVIKEFGQWMIDNDDARLIVEGHADERGTREYNLALGARRANAAKRYIVAMGVAPSRIKTISFGKERPDDPRSNQEAWSKNRRFVALKIE